MEVRTAGRGDNSGCGGGGEELKVEVVGGNCVMGTF